MNFFYLLKYSRYAVCLIFILWGSLQQGWAQTENDLVLVDPNGFKLCNNDNTGEALTIYNQCTHAGFGNGTFSVDWGDGSAVEAWGTEETMVHTYMKFGVLDLVFSWKSSDGTKRLSRTYKVLRLKKPIVTLKEGDSGNACNNIAMELKLGDDYALQTDGTVYRLDYGDGKIAQFTQKEIVEEHRGIIKHKFETENCPITVKMNVTNECPGLEWETTFKTAVVVPPKARFMFTGTMCTGYPLGVVNTSIEGVDVQCKESTDFIWKFGDKPSIFGRDPSVVFDQPGEYEVRLIAWTNNLECSRDTMIKKVSVLRSPDVNFSIDKDKICSGETVRVIDNSLGDSLAYLWNVSGTPINTYSFVNGTNRTSVNPEVLLEGYGTYTLSLSLNNGCPVSEDSKVVTVLKDPEIIRDKWIDSLCALDTEDKHLISMENYLEIAWNGNQKKTVWKIEPLAGMSGSVEYLPGFGADSEYPRVNLKVGSTYAVSLVLDAASVEGRECGSVDKRTFSGTLKIKDPKITVDVKPDKLPEADGWIKICDGEQITFTNLSSGENLKHRWSVVPIGSNASSWNIEYVSGSATEGSPVMKFNGYGDYMVTDRMSGDCNEKSVSFAVRVGKDPEVFITNFPQELCPRDALEAEVCIFYEWYNNPHKVRWEFTPNTVEYLGGTSADSPEPLVRFQTSEVYKYTVKIPGVGCPNTDTVVEGKLRVRRSGLDVIVKEREDRSEACEGMRLTFTNKTEELDTVAMDLNYEWSIQIPDIGEAQGGTEDDCEFLGGKKNDMVAAVTFKKWGTYDVVATVRGVCDTVVRVLRIRVKKNPEVRLEEMTGCPGKIVLANDTTYKWWNNTPVVAWDIRREDGMDQPDDHVEAAGALTQLYPEIDFKRPGRYRVKATLKNAGCPEEDPSAEVSYWIYDPVVYGDIVLKSPVPANPLATDVCENEVVEFENTQTEEADLLRWEWSVEGGAADGFQFIADGVEVTPEEGKGKKAPGIRFLKYGEYDVKVITYSTCSQPVAKVFHVTVRGIPDIVLAPRMEKICADQNLEPEGTYLQYTDKKNSVLTYQWSVVADRDVTLPVFDATAEYPVFDFNRENARYTITLKAFSKCAEDGVQTLTSEVDVISTFRQAAFAVDSVGCTDFELMLDNRSVGDSLSYTWSVVSTTASGLGWTYSEGDEHTESPRLKVTESGFYDISLQVRNVCGTADSTFRVKAYSVPEIRIADIAGVCEPLAFKGKDLVTVDEKNDPVTAVQWKIVSRPGSVSEGYEYVNGTSENSAYPDLVFKACDYEVSVEYHNRCPEPGRDTFLVRVDKFVPIEPLEDKAVCVLTDPFELQAQPGGGVWTLKEGHPGDAGRILYTTEGGKSFFRPEFDAYFEGDVELVYSRTNFSCMARDTMKVHIWPLPHVEAGDPLEMCINNEPYLLKNGRPEKGYWTLEDNTILAMDYYTVSEAGDFKLLYYFRDEHTCLNVDSTVMTVHPLPDTKFAVQALNCIHTEVAVKPNQLGGNRFVWDFGDASPEVVSKGDTVHVYNDFGFRKISNVTTSVHGCTDRSDTVRIEIVNVPPVAFFEADPLIGCARFGVVPDSEIAMLKVDFSVDTAVYADNHNYLSFKWAYGDGTFTDTLTPISPKYYPSGAWDTTYAVRFAVSNMCGIQEYDTVVTVLSAPKVKFALKHEWECTPVKLELQNTTTGNNVVYAWTFENRRTGEIVERTNVRNPVYEFVTDSASTTYYITLKASNACDEDVHTDSLVVKPRTISAHFTPSKRDVCVGEEICFRNNSTDTLTSIENVYWNFGDGGRDTLWNPCHVYQAAQKYEVRLLIDNGCGFHSVNDTITVHPLPVLSVRGEDYLCEADTFSFVLNSDQELKFVTWDFGDGQQGHRDSVWHLYDGYGKYVVAVEGVSAQIAGCVAKVLKEIEIYNKPIVTIVPLDTVGCSPLLYKPELTGDGFFMWDFGDGSSLSSSEEHLYENLSDTVQKFNVTAYVETDKGCKSVYKGHTTVYYLPEATIGKEVTKGKPEKVAYLNLSKGHTAAFWSLPSKGIVHSLENQEEEFNENGLYWAGLVVQSYYGCQDTAEMEHLVQMKGLYFPNTFILNSTNEKVSRFNGIAIGLKEYWLEIYDYYGNKIWETKALENGKPSEGWDGRNKNGELMPQGTYIWRARAIFVNDEAWTGKNNDSGVKETVQGTVLLLRE